MTGRACSLDLGERVVAARFGVAPSSVVKWSRPVAGICHGKMPVASGLDRPDVAPYVL